MRWKYDDEARHDPEKLEEERAILLEIASVGDEVADLVGRLQAAMRRIPRSQRPDSCDSMVEDVRTAVARLAHQQERAFKGARERARNETYLGNRAAHRHGHQVED